MSIDIPNKLEAAEELLLEVLDATGGKPLTSVTLREAAKTVRHSHRTALRALERLRANPRITYTPNKSEPGESTYELAPAPEPEEPRRALITLERVAPLRDALTPGDQLEPAAELYARGLSERTFNGSPWLAGASPRLLLTTLDAGQVVTKPVDGTLEDVTLRGTVIVGLTWPAQSSIAARLARELDELGRRLEPPRALHLVDAESLPQPARLEAVLRDSILLDHPRVDEPYETRLLVLADESVVAHAAYGAAMLRGAIERRLPPDLTLFQAAELA